MDNYQGSSQHLVLTKEREYKKYPNLINYLFTHTCIHATPNQFSFMVETNVSKDCYEKCHGLTISTQPKVCIAVNIAELRSCEITYRIIDGICNQHYDNQRGHQDENTLQESEKPQSKVIFIDFKKGRKR